MKRLLLVVSIIGVGLVGCTSNSTNPDTPTVSFLAKKAGMYINSNTRVVSKTDAGADTLLANYMDSTVYGGEASVADSRGTSMAASLYPILTGGFPTDTTILSENGAKLNWLFTLGNTIPGLGTLDLGERWIVASDQHGTTWTALQDTVTGLTIDYAPGITLNIDGIMNMTGTNVGKENLIINGKTVSTSHVKLNYTITFTITAGAFGAIPSQPIVIPIDLWLLEGVGPVKMTTGVSKLVLEGLAARTIIIPGVEKVATNYFVP